MMPAQAREFMAVLGVGITLCNIHNFKPYETLIHEDPMPTEAATTEDTGVSV